MKPDTPRILGINPWIHDFAAYDFWARPLGLFYLLAMLGSAGAKVDYYDCLGRANARAKPKNRFGCGPYKKTPIPAPKVLTDVPRNFSRYGVNPDQFKNELAGLKQPDLVLVTSLMTYWYPGVFEAIKIVRKIWPKVKIILGGIYATLCADHARAYSAADEVFCGQAELEIIDIVSRHIGWKPPRPFWPQSLDDYPYPALDLGGKPLFAPVLTSRGCPFRCAYCASGFLHPEFIRRNPKAVAEEIRFWHNKFGVRDFVFYDDALLMNPQNNILPLLDTILSMGLDLRFHTPNAVHIRNLSARVAKNLFKAGFTSLCLGLETAVFTDRKSLDAKVTQTEFENAARNLKEAGFDNKFVGAYLLSGLPDQDYDALIDSIQIVKQAGIRPILAHYTPIPHTLMWEQAKKSSRYDLDADPVCTNNAVSPCQKEPFSWKKLTELKKLCV